MDAGDGLRERLVRHERFVSQLLTKGGRTTQRGSVRFLPDFNPSGRSRLAASRPRHTRTRDRRILVFPHPDDRPASFDEAPVRLRVALDVAGEFGGPPVRVGGRRRSMLRARMPEAAVDEDRNLRPREHDVSCPSQVGQRPNMHPIAEAKAVQTAPQQHLRSGITSGLPAHASARL